MSQKQCTPRLLRLYVFPLFNPVEWGGIWETEGVTGLGTPDERWTLRLKIVWAGCRDLDTVENVPPQLIEFGCEFDRAALAGKVEA